jgi:hypothetical protein
LPIPSLCPNRKYPVEICIGREDVRFIDHSQLFFDSLLHLEICSLRKHRKDHSDQFMSGSKYSYLRSQSFSLSLEEIGFKESFLAHPRRGHQVDSPSKMPTQGPHTQEEVRSPAFLALYSILSYITITRWRKESTSSLIACCLFLQQKEVFT